MQRQGFNVAGIGDLLAGVMAAGDGAFRRDLSGVTVTSSLQRIFGSPVEQDVPYGFLVHGTVNTAGGIGVVLQATVTGGTPSVQLNLLSSAASGIASNYGSAPQVAYTPAAGARRAFLLFGTVLKTTAGGTLAIDIGTAGGSVTLEPGSAGYAWRLRG